jgi:hypothetical protein
VDGSGNVYVADYGNSLVKEILAADGSVHTLGNGFAGPTGVAVDGVGNVYVANQDDGSVKEIVLASGSVKTLGTGFNLPRDVAVDGIGNVYVADTYNNAVKVISATDGSMRTIGSGFNIPGSIIVDAGGDVYVADYNNNRVVLENFATPPTLNFATPTNVDGTDTADGPQTLSLQNIGSAPLTLTSTGAANPSLSTGFTLANGSTTCAISNGTAATVTSNAICAYAVNFTPLTAGNIQGQLILTDNNATAFGTAKSATQTILLTGTAVGTATITVTGTLPAATAGVSYSGSFTAAGGVAPYTYSATGLPTGLTLSSSGVLSGTPSIAGSYTITVTAKDANSLTGTAAFPLSVAVSTLDFQLTLANVGTQSIANNAAAQYTLNVSPATGNFPFPVTFTVTGLPEGFSENFSPATVTPGSSTVQTQLTIRNTTSFASQHSNNPFGIVTAFLLFPLALSRKLRHRLQRSLLVVLLLCCTLSAAVTLTGCTAVQINPATYNVVITATGNNFHHSVMTVLNVR